MEDNVRGKVTTRNTYASETRAARFASRTRKQNPCSRLKPFCYNVRAMYIAEFIYITNETHCIFHNNRDTYPCSSRPRCVLINSPKKKEEREKKVTSPLPNHSSMSALYFLHGNKNDPTDFCASVQCRDASRRAARWRAQLRVREIKDDRSACANNNDSLSSAKWISRGEISATDLREAKPWVARCRSVLRLS